MQARAERGRFGLALACVGAAALMFAVLSLMLVLSGPAVPGPRFGPRFWAPWLIGILTLTLSGAVWALRPREDATRLFLVNGFAFMASSLAIAIHTVSAPGDNPLVLQATLIVNHAANQLFYLSLLALFLQYPLRLVRPAVAWGLLVLTAPMTAALVFKWLPGWVLVYGLSIAQLTALLTLIIWQWIATRRLPRDRAALTWLALSVVIGTALWICLLVFGLMHGDDRAISSILSLVLFFPFYIGLAMGVARFCLVELEDWTFRILFFVVAALLFAAVDAALVALLGVGKGPATGIALMLIAFVYLPLRDIVWRRFVGGRAMSQTAMFAAVMEVVFAPSPAQRAARWRGLLQDLFQPLRLEPALSPPLEPVIAEGGLRLDLPAAAEAPALSLSLARQGRGLFSPSQVGLARQLIRLVRTASTSRDAYERGAAEMRLRLAQDLHDDVAARLMSGLAAADDRTRPILHGALSDIRAIAGGWLGEAAPLDRILADIRHECVRRFEAAGLQTDWPVWPDDAPLVMVDYARHKALASALREAASNVIRHSGARIVTVTAALAGDGLAIRLSDDGKGLSPGVLSGAEGGQGLSGLIRRLAEAGGAACFGNGHVGAWVEFSLPLTQPDKIND